jgi:hypothetical protein
MHSFLISYPIPRWAAVVTLIVGCLLQLLFMVTA